MGVWRFTPVLCGLGLAAGSEICLVVPSHGLTSLSSECLASEAPIPYGVSIYEGGQRFSTKSIGCHLGLEISGELGHTSQIALSSPTAVVKKQLQIMAVPLGHVTGGSIRVLDRGCDVPWACTFIEVSDGHRWWSLDCEGTIHRRGDEMTLRLGGLKPYRITVVTDGEGGGDKSMATIGMSLKGVDGSSTRALTLMTGERSSGMLYQTVLKAADVGVIASINITNYAPTEPWRFKSLLIYTDDGNVARFDGGQWIGSPFVSSMEIVNLQEAGHGTLDVIATPVECHTRLEDILSGTSQQLTALKIYCPPGCDASPLAHVAGLSIHPSSSSMCASAYVDGMIGPSGGDVMLLLRASQSRSYDPVLRNISEVPVHPYRSEGTGANSLYIPVVTDTIDDIAAIVRVVDSFGKLSHTGRLELRRGGTWGSICTHGTTQTFNGEAAKVACKEMGYLWGELIEEPCTAALGYNFCGAKTLPVHSGAVNCKGDESSFGDCVYQEATASTCAKHEADVVVHCSDHPPTQHPMQGTVRIVDTSGAPAASGIGRVEMFVSDQWGTICNDDWRRESAGVVCRELGYDSVADLSSMTNNKTLDDDVCRDVLGSDYCGSLEEKIAAANIACEGSEERLRDCPMVVAEDIYCVHSEDVVVGCKGAGDPSGVGLYIKDQLPSIKTLPLRSLVNLKCTDTYASITAKDDLLPGTILPVACPSDCREQSGTVVGSDIYTTASSVCHAGIHAGVNTDSGTPFAVVAAHGQSQFTGTMRNGISSNEAGQSMDAFMAVPLLPDLSSKMQVNLTKSDLGFYGTSKLVKDFKTFRDDWQSVQTSLSFLAIQVKEEKADKDTDSVSPLVSFCNGDPGVVKFRGGTHDLVTLSYLPHGAELPLLKSFSIFFRIKPAVAGDQRWRSIVSYSECEGFAVSIDPHGEIVFEQMCSPHVLYSG